MKNLAALLIALVFSGNAMALSLSEAYEAALQNDPFFQMAGFAQQAGMEEKNLARSQILPEVALSFRKYGNKAERVTALPTGSYTEQIDYKSSVAGVYLRQSIINLEKYANYQLGGIRSASADMQYLASRQEMIVRIVTAFLDAVAAKQALELSKIEKNAIAEQHQQAKRFYASGEGTITDIDEAKARLDLAAVQEMEANDRYLLNLSILGQLTARDPDRLPEFEINIVYKDGAPAANKGLEDWIQRAMDNNFELAGKRLAVEAAERDLLKARSGYFPSVDIVASISRSDQESLTTINQNITNHAIGVELMLPLVKGGYYAALIRQSEAKRQQALRDVEATKVRIRVDVSRQYRDTENGYAKVEALANAVRSNEKAIESISMGFKAGTRTSVDILNAKKDWIRARKDYVDSLHDSIIARFKLEFAAGSLDESLVHWAEKYLVSVR